MENLIMYVNTQTQGTNTASSEKGWLFLTEGLQGKSDRCDLELRVGFQIA